MGTLCIVMGGLIVVSHLRGGRHVSMMFDAHSASMARWELRADADECIYGG